MTGNGKPWYKTTWMIISYICGMIYVAVTNAPQFFENLQKTPATVISTYNQFSSWYFDDDSWSGLWSSNTGFSVDWQDMHLSDTDLVVSMESYQGTISGVIFTKNVCNTIPLLGMLMLEGKVNFFGESADGMLFEYIDGSRKNLSTIKLTKNGSLLDVLPINDRFKFIPAKIKIIKQIEIEDESKSLLPNDENGFIDVCKEQREKLFKKP